MKKLVLYLCLLGVLDGQIQATQVEAEGQDVRNYTDAPVIMRDARYPNAPSRIIPRSW